jgi:two-component system sensor histidine kinase VicK
VVANRRAHELLGSEIPVGRDLFARALAGELIEGELIELAGEDAAERTLEVRAAPVRGRGRRIVSAVATFVDVTERERRERAEREFISNAAHELRTPLAAITSALEVLQGGGKEDPEARDRFLSHLEQQCNRLNRLVPGLLMLARAQMRQATMEHEVIPLRPLLDALVAELHPAPGIAVAVDCDPQLAVVANRTLTEQVLWNLAANAERYTSAGSIELNAREDGGWAAIEVRDTGPGIDEHDLDRVFERFYRGEGTAPGFGLGLAIVHESVTAMGGSVAIASEPGRGTSAEIRLPAATLAET